MIYSYIKQQLEPLENNPEEYFQALNTMDAEIQLLRDRYTKVWTYCCGCRGYVKRVEAYEALEPSNYSDDIRRVLRCGTCNTTWKVIT